VDLTQILLVSASPVGSTRDAQWHIQAQSGRTSNCPVLLGGGPVGARRNVRLPPRWAKASKDESEAAFRRFVEIARGRAQ
jgi:hypothetical protein